MHGIDMIQLETLVYRYDWVWVVNAHLRSEWIIYIGESCRPTKLFEIWKVFLSTNDHRLQIESVLFSGLCSHGSNQPRVSGLITKSLHSCQSIVRLHIEWEFAIACWCWGAGVWEYRHKDNQHFWKHAPPEMTLNVFIYLSRCDKVEKLRHFTARQTSHAMRLWDGTCLNTIAC